MKTFIFLISAILMIFSPLTAIEFPEIKNWQPESEVSSYNSATLYEYINGGADQFISYGFEILYSRDVKNGDVTVTVDIYDMGNPLNAFGVYKIERPKDQPYLKYGTESVLVLPYQCLLLKDRYYVKVNVFDGELTSNTGEELLKAVADVLPGESNLPEEFNYFPQKGKITDSEGFAKEAFLGLAELRNCIFVNYKIGNDEFKYFQMVPTTENSIETIWEELHKKWVSQKYKGKPILYRKIPYSGLNGIVMVKDKIYGVSNCNSEDQIFKRLGFFIGK